MAFEHSLGWSYGLIKMVMVVLYLLSNSNAQIKISVTFDVVKEFRMWQWFLALANPQLRCFYLKKLELYNDS